MDVYVSAWCSCLLVCMFVCACHSRSSLFLWRKIECISRLCQYLLSALLSHCFWNMNMKWKAIRLAFSNIKDTCHSKMEVQLIQYFKMSVLVHLAVLCKADGSCDQMHSCPAYWRWLIRSSNSYWRCFCLHFCTHTLTHIHSCKPRRDMGWTAQALIWPECKHPHRIVVQLKGRTCQESVFFVFPIGVRLGALTCIFM